MLDSLKEEEEDAEAEKNSPKEKWRPTDRACRPRQACESSTGTSARRVRDAPVTKGKVSLLEAAGAPRLIKIDFGRGASGRRGQEYGFCGDVRAAQRVRGGVRGDAGEPPIDGGHACGSAGDQVNVFDDKDPANGNISCGLPEGRVDVPEAYDEVECSDILECRRVTLPEIEPMGSRRRRTAK